MCACVRVCACVRACAFVCNLLGSMHHSNIANLTRPEPGDDTLFLMDMVELFLREMAESDKPFFLYIPVHTGKHSGD